MHGFPGVFPLSEGMGFIHVIHFIRKRILLFSTAVLPIYNPFRIRYNVLRTVLF